MRSYVPPLPPLHQMARGQTRVTDAQAMADVLIHRAVRPGVSYWREGLPYTMWGGQEVQA